MIKRTVTIKRTGPARVADIQRVEFSMRRGQWVSMIEVDLGDGATDLVEVPGLPPSAVRDWALAALDAHYEVEA